MLTKPYGDTNGDASSSNRIESNRIVFFLAESPSTNFHGFRRYVFSTLRNEANVIMYYYLIPFRLSADPEIMTLGDCEWLECSLYVAVLRSAFE